MIRKTLLILFITPLSIFTLFSQKTFQKSLYFEPNASKINDNHITLLFQLVDTLSEFADFNIAILGAAEADVSSTLNKKLSEQRIKNVKDYLMKNGVSQNKMSLAIESETLNSAQLSDNEKALTRRVDMIIRFTEKTTPSVSEAKSDEIFNENKNISNSQSNSYDSNITFKKSELQKLYDSIADQPTVKIIQVSKTKTMVIEGEKGTVVLIPPDALDLPEDSQVIFTLREAYTMSDMLAENLTTQAGNQMLASGGMVKITATVNGKEIQPQKPFVLMMPKYNPDKMSDSMQLFNGVADNRGNINWQLPSNGGFQLQKRVFLKTVEQKMWELVNLKANYRFFTDTCGCDKMYVWKMPKKQWKNQKKLFQEGKTTAMPPRFIYSEAKPPAYDFYKVNARSPKSLSTCNDTLSSFCKIIARSQTPKSFKWQERHKFIDTWKLSKKAKSLASKVKTYQGYKVKTYYQYLESMRRDMALLESYLASMGLEKALIDSMSKANFKKIIAAQQQKKEEEYRKMSQDFLDGKNKGGAALAANYYIFEARNFNWANCDYFIKYPKLELVDVKTKLANSTNVDAKLIFKQLNVIYPADYDKNPIVFKNVKENESAIVVSLKTENQKAYLAIQPIVTGSEKTELKYEEVTPQLLKEKLKTLDKYQIKLFPNPASDVLTVQVNSTFNGIQVVNTSGQIVLDERNLNTSEHQIKVAQLPNNMYIIRIIEGNLLRGGEKCVINH
jgi:hypothetical protein